MNVISAYTNTLFDGFPGSADRFTSNTDHGHFNDLLETVTTRVDDPVDPDVDVEPRNEHTAESEGDDSERDDAGHDGRDDGQDNGHDKSQAETAGDGHRARESSTNTVFALLSIPKPVDAQNATGVDAAPSSTNNSSNPAKDATTPKPVSDHSVGIAAAAPVKEAATPKPASDDTVKNVATAPAKDAATPKLVSDHSAGIAVAGAAKDAVTPKPASGHTAGIPVAGPATAISGHTVGTPVVSPATAISGHTVGTPAISPAKDAVTPKPGSDVTVKTAAPGPVQDLTTPTPDSNVTVRIATAAPAKDGTIPKDNSGNAAEAPELAPRLKFDAQVSQELPGVRSRPLTAIANGIASTDASGILAMRATARTATDKSFMARESAIERLAARKSAQQLAPQSAENASKGQDSSFGTRIAGLTDRLAQLSASSNTQRQTRPNMVVLPASSNANLAASPAPRAGELPFALTAGDTQSDAMQLAGQAAARTVHSGNAVAHVASRAQPFPAGTPSEQVSVQIQQGVRNNADRINVRLYPAALGKVEVKLELSPDKTVHAIVTAERPETLDMLARDARVLQRALESVGLQTDSDSLSFQQNNGGDSAASGFARHEGDGPGDRAGSPKNNGPEETAAIETPETRRAVHDGVLDVEI